MVFIICPFKLHAVHMWVQFFPGWKALPILSICSFSMSLILDLLVEACIDQIIALQSRFKLCHPNTWSLGRWRLWYPHGSKLWKLQQAMSTSPKRQWLMEAGQAEGATFRGMVVACWNVCFGNLQMRTVTLHQHMDPADLTWILDVYIICMSRGTQDNVHILVPVLEDHIILFQQIFNQSALQLLLCFRSLEC